MRTRIIALLLASAGLTLTTAACRSGESDNQVEAVETAKSGINLAAMDKSVKPGDDFFMYANGTWFKNSEIPADRGSIGSFWSPAGAGEAARTRCLPISPSPMPRPAPTNASWPIIMPPSWTRRGSTRALLPALKADIDRFMAIADKRALAEAIGTTIRADTDPLNATDLHTENLFGIFVTQSMSQPNKNVPYLLQGGIGLPDRDYYLSSDAEMAKIRDAYRPFIAKMLSHAGLDDAEARAQRVYDLERKIAAAHATIVETGDSIKANNPWSQAEFAKKAPGMDWNAFFRGAQLATVPTIVVWHPGADPQAQRAGRERAARRVEGLAGVPPDHPVGPACCRARCTRMTSPFSAPPCRARRRNGRATSSCSGTSTR